MFCGRFCVWSPSLNVQAHFVAEDKVTSSVLVSGLKLSEEIDKYI